MVSRTKIKRPGHSEKNLTTFYKDRSQIKFWISLNKNKVTNKQVVPYENISMFEYLGNKTTQLSAKKNEGDGWDTLIKVRDDITKHALRQNPQIQEKTGQTQEHQEGAGERNEKERPVMEQSSCVGPGQEWLAGKALLVAFILHWTKNKA